MATTVRDFIFQAYRLINASNPTVPLHGDDQNLGIQVLNQLLQSYASTGLLLTIAKTVTIPLTIGQQEIIVAAPGTIPTPDIAEGRLANIESAWLELSGVSYPLIQESKGVFLESWKYTPLQGLPRFIIVFPQTDFVALRLYPSPSQFFDFFLRAKFQLPELTSNDPMASVPQYYQRYLLFALAKDIALYKGRAEAWTPFLEQQYVEAKDIMIAASEVNLAITGDKDSLLNGAWRIRAGI